MVAVLAIQYAARAATLFATAAIGLPLRAWRVGQPQYEAEKQPSKRHGEPKRAARMRMVAKITSRLMSRLNPVDAGPHYGWV